MTIPIGNGVSSSLWRTRTTHLNHRFLDCCRHPSHCHYSLVKTNGRALEASIAAKYQERKSHVITAEVETVPETNKANWIGGLFGNRRRQRPSNDPDLSTVQVAEPIRRF